MDSDERAAGRIVVCVEADADVSTAMMSSLFQGDPSTALASAFSTSSLLLVRKVAPWKDCAAIETIT